MLTNSQASMSVASSSRVTPPPPDRSPSPADEYEGDHLEAQLYRNNDDVAKDDACGDCCLICLGDIEDRTALPACQHSLFCFACIVRWLDVHRRCPLCSTPIGSYILHAIHSDSDYVRHHLPEVPHGEANKRVQASRATQLGIIGRRRIRESRHEQDRLASVQRTPAQSALERWEYQVSIRRRIYRQSLFCQHVGSNRSSRLAPPPTPAAIAATPSLQTMMLAFIRRELSAFPSVNLDIEFVSTYAMHVFRTLDIKADESMTLLSGFLGHDGAQHFCHEVYSFARFVASGSGKHSDKLAGFDAWARYAWPEERIAQRLRHEAEQRARPSAGCAQPTQTSSSAASEVGASVDVL